MCRDLLKRISPDPQANYRAAIAGRFVSLWDMLQLQTETFLSALTLLASTVGDLKVTSQVVLSGQAASAELHLLSKAHVIKAIEILKATAEQHGLKATLLCANRCYDASVNLLAPQRPMALPEIFRLASSLEMLIHTVIDEAESRSFYTLGSKAEMDHKSADELFGQKVVDAFPSAVVDLEEAGRCLAFQLWTASVMHLMRALEPALAGLARHVGVQMGANWNQTLDQVEKQLRLVTKRNDGAEAEEWAAEAGAQLRFIKNAWRNSAMHGGAIYDERRARSVFETTRSLMQHLAEKLSETD